MHLSQIMYTKHYNTVSDCGTGLQGFASVEISHDCSHKGGGGGGANLDLLGFLCVTEETLRSTAIIFLYTKLLNQGLQDIVFNRGAIIIILNSSFFILLSTVLTVH